MSPSNGMEFAVSKSVTDASPRNAFIEALPIPAVWVREDETITSVNRPFERLSGFGRHEIEDRKTWRDFLHEERATAPPSADAPLPEVRECQLIDNTGALKNVIVSGTRATGTAERLFTFIDVTGYKCREERERREKEGFISALQRVPYGIIILDAEGRNTFINERFTAIAGYDAADIPTFAEWLLRAHPDQKCRRRVRDAWRDDLRKRKNGYRTFTVVCKTGETKEIEFGYARLEEGGTLVTLSDVTKRRDAERRLRESEQKFRSLFEKTPDASILFDGDVIFDFNPAALEMLQCTDKAGLVGHRPSELSPEMQPDGLTSAEKELAIVEMARLVGPLRFEWVHRRFDGKEFQVEITFTPIPLNGRQVFYCVWRDISDRKKTEERLLFTQSAIDQAKDCIFFMDKDGKIVYVNEAACQTLGYTREELLTMSVPDVDPDCSHEVWKHRWLLKKHCGSLVLEARHGTKDGRIYPVEVSTRILPFKDNEYSCAIVRDISERKRAEAALRESEERFRQLFEQNDEALIIFHSGTSRILDANPSAVSLYGYSRDELIKRGPSLFFARPEFDRFRGLLSRIKETESFVIENVTSSGEDGRKIDVMIRGKTIRLSNANVIYCTFKDLTEQIRLREEAAILHSKLIQANKMTSLGVLVSGVAHEVNNPNNFIMFNASLLSDAWQDALKILDGYSRENGEFSLGGLPFSEMQTVVMRLLQGITDGSHRIKGIVDNLKDFARQDSARLDDAVDLNKVVSGSASLLASQIKAHTRSFSLELAPDLPLVKGSFQQLEQVIINLVMNGLQALPGKERGIKVATSFDPPRRQVTVSVKDEGTGISKEIMEKITEPFFTTRLDRGGTGLGLSISMSIIRDHHGIMEFESEPGKGTDACIRLPVL